MSTEPSEIARMLVYLGSLFPDSAAARLKVSDRPYAWKNPDSSPENWERIIALLERPDVNAVVLRLNTAIYENIVSPHYLHVRDRLMAAVAAKRHIVFVHEAVVFGETENEVEISDLSHESLRELAGILDEEEYASLVQELNDWELRRHFFRPPSDQVRAAVSDLLDGYGVDVIPYKTNAEFSVLLGAFVDDAERDLLFRVYIPRGRIFAAEADKLLGMFTHWLGQAGIADVRQDGYSTSAGQVYEFFGGAVSTRGDLSQRFSEFTDFLWACADRPRMQLMI